MKRCETHPDYKGIYRPRVLCSDCWRIYTGRQFAEAFETFPGRLHGRLDREDVSKFLRLEGQ